MTKLFFSIVVLSSLYSLGQHRVLGKVVSSYCGGNLNLMNGGLGPKRACEANFIPLGSSDSSKNKLGVVLEIESATGIVTEFSEYYQQPGKEYPCVINGRHITCRRNARTVGFVEKDGTVKAYGASYAAESLVETVQNTLDKTMDMYITARYLIVPFKSKSMKTSQK